MEDNAFADKAKEFFKQNLLVVGVFFIGLILFSIGVIQFMGGQKSDITFKSGQEIAVKSGDEKIVVDISGAVVRPGVFTLTKDSRIQDALVASGGLSSDADRDYVSKAVNLAQRLTDGQKLYIPKIGEKNPAGSANSLQASSQSFNDGKIHINSATITELDALSGVGQVTAQRIIDGRPYAKIDELATKKVVSQKVFDSIKDKIDL